MCSGAAAELAQAVPRQRPAVPVAILVTMMVRRATEADTEAMAHVFAVVAEEGSIGTEPPVDVPARAQRLEDMLHRDRPGAMWVLDDHGQVVGTTTASEHGPPGVLSLGMALLPQARGQGGGRALLDAVLDHARSCGAHKVELEVWPDNARAISLYATAGFTVEGLRRNHYRRRDGTLRSALIMAHPISGQ